VRLVEVPFDNMIWPERCCSCGSAAVSWRKHSDKVVIWTLPGVNSYRRISLPIPVCDTCAFRSYYWFAFAMAIVAGALLVGERFSRPDNPLGSYFGLVVLVALAMVWKGARTKPIRILGFNPDTRKIRLKLRDDEVATALLRNPDSALLEGERAGRAGALFIVGGVVLIVIAGVRSAWIWARA
jgi:hypothetical protein